MKGIFVTGTDTGVGKTLVMALLARYLLEKRYKVITQKWIQTGCAGFPSDIQLHLKIMGRKRKDIKNYLGLVCPYAFKFSGSPHLSSKLEKKKININKIIKSFRLLSAQFDFVLVEGIGGALVPIDKRHLTIDLVKELDLPVLLVAQNKLGAINHTLLSIEAIKSRGLEILGVIFNNLKGQDPIIIRDNPKIIEGLTRERVLGVLPWQKNTEILYREFAPIAKKIIL